MGPVPAADTRRLAPGVHTSPGTGYAAPDEQTHQGRMEIREQTHGRILSRHERLRQNLEKILQWSKIPGHYSPAKWALSHYGNENAGKRLLEFVKKHFSHRVTLPPRTKYLQL